jgi:hypothetical protein
MNAGNGHVAGEQRDLSAGCEPIQLFGNVANHLYCYPAIGEINGQ